jgi:hypothetical protein
MRPATYSGHDAALSKARVSGSVGSLVIGVSVRGIEVEAGDRVPRPAAYERISELYGWPGTCVSKT